MFLIEKNDPILHLCEWQKCGKASSISSHFKMEFRVINGAVKGWVVLFEERGSARLPLTDDFDHFRQ